MPQGAQFMEDAQVDLSLIEPTTNLPGQCLNQSK
jgi:hypothetical protein